MSNEKMSDNLDYNVNTIEERLEIVNKIISDNDDALVDFYSNHYNPHINQTGFLSENTKIGKDLEALASYLLYAKDSDATEDIITDYRKKRNNVREASIENLYVVTSNDSKKKSQTNAKSTKIKVLKEDRIKHEELKSSGEIIATLSKMIKTKKDTKGNTLTEKEVRKLKWIRTDIQKDEIAVKKELKGYIQFQSVTKSEKDLMALSNIRYDDIETIRVIIENYEELKQVCENDTHGYLKVIMFDIENLIEETQFEDHMKDILIYKMKNVQYDDIIKLVKEKYDMKITKPRLSKFTRETIPAMIVNTYKQKKEDWIFTEILRGNYKTCSECKKNYLATSKYFNTAKGSLRSDCKICRSKKYKKKSSVKSVKQD